MRKNVLKVLMFFFCMGLWSENLHVFKFEGKYGYFNDRHEVKIKPEYERARKFTGDYAIVATRNSKNRIGYNVINKKNQMPDPKLTDCFSLTVISENLYYSNGFGSFLYNIKTKKDYNSYSARCQNPETGKSFYIPVSGKGTGGVRYINAAGKTKPIKGEWLKLYPMVYGAAFAVNKDFDQFIIDEEGNILVSEVADSGYNFSEGLLALKTSHESGFINNKGEFVFHCDFEPYHHEFWPPGLLYPFREGIVVVQVSNGIYKIFNKKGEVIMDETPFFFCSYCNSGLIMFQKVRKGKFGYLGKEGQTVIPEIFDAAEDFEDGYALVVYKGKDGVLDAKRNLYYSEDLMNGRKEPAERF